MDQQQQQANGQDNTNAAAGDVNGQNNDGLSTQGEGQQQDADGTLLNGEGQGNQGAQGEGQGNADGEGKDGEGDGKGDNAEVEYNFELPEGYTLDEEIGNELKEMAKAKNLSAEEAQKFVDLGVKMKEKEAEAFNKIQNEWVEQIKADPMIGGEKLGENIAVAKKAIDAFGTPELKSLLDKSRFGNHPEVVKFAYQVGKAMSEDRIVVGQGKPRGAPATPAKTLFPNQS